MNYEINSAYKLEARSYQEQSWLQATLKDLDSDELSHESHYDSNGRNFVVFHAQSQKGISELSQFLREFLVKFRPRESIYVEFSELKGEDIRTIGGPPVEVPQYSGGFVEINAENTKTQRTKETIDKARSIRNDLLLEEFALDNRICFVQDSGLEGISDLLYEYPETFSNLFDCLETMAGIGKICSKILVTQETETRFYWKAVRSEGDVLYEGALVFEYPNNENQQSLDPVNIAPNNVSPRWVIHS